MHTTEPGDSMNRRAFIRYASAISASLAFADKRCLGLDAAAPQGWRTFEIRTSVEVLKPSGATRMWLPAPLISENPFQKTLANDFRAEGGRVSLIEAEVEGLGIISAEFAPGVRPVMTATSRVATRDYTVDISAPGKTLQTNRSDLARFLRPTRLLPTDGIVKTTAMENH
jgi:hypothetical protein